IINIPENPVQTIIKYSGAITIALIITAIILTKKKLAPLIKNKICKT
ncbi:MAG: hypothetical protein GXO43_00210, partial [Crenarchaeota archaeon]|nr:hypothetical protein [Thermoproteota archaeon]